MSKRVLVLAALTLLFLLSLFNRAEAVTFWIPDGNGGYSIAERYTRMAEEAVPLLEGNRKLIFNLSGCERVQRTERMRLVGCITSFSTTIWLDGDLSQKRKDATFLHELGHMVDNDLLTDYERTVFRRMFRLTGAWLAIDQPDNSPESYESAGSEAFADYFAACLLRRVARTKRNRPATFAADLGRPITLAECRKIGGLIEGPPFLP